MYEITRFDYSFGIEPRQLRREAIRRLEHEILECVPAEMPVEHLFAKGLYARSLTIPKNCVLTGAIHKHEHINILAKGDITVVTDDGPVRIQAPYVMVSKPGTKRAGFAHEESVWVTVHACDETEVELAEAALVTNDYDEWLRLQQCHSQLPAQS
jgi:hypothetical protein